jgi:hypothetical protein
MEAGLIPDPDFATDSDAVESRYPRVERKSVDLRADNRLPVVLAERAAALRARDEAQARVDAAEAEIKHKLGDAEEALIEGWRVRWSAVERAGFTVAPTTFRRLTIKERKDE